MRLPKSGFAGWLTCVFALSFVVKSASAWTQNVPVDSVRPVQREEEAAITSLTYKFFDAYKSKDVDAIAALWDSSSPQYLPFLKRTEYILSSEDIEQTHVHMAYQWFSNASEAKALVYVIADVKRKPFSDSHVFFIPPWPGREPFMLQIPITDSSGFMPQSPSILALRGRAGRQGPGKPVKQPVPPERAERLVRTLGLVKTDRWRIVYYGPASNNMTSNVLGAATDALAAEWTRQQLPALRFVPDAIFPLAKDLASLAGSINERADLLTLEDDKINRVARSQAIRLYNAAQMLMEEQHSGSMDYWIHLGLGRSYLGLKQTDKAIREFREAIDANARIYKTSHDPNWRVPYFAYRYLLRALQGADRHTEVLACVHTALGVLRAPKGNDWIADFEVYRAFSSAPTDPALAIRSYERAIALKAALGKTADMCWVRVALADAYLAQDNYSKAGLLYKASLEEYRKRNDLSTAAHCQLGLGWTLYGQGDYGFALLKFTSVRDTFRANRYRLGLASALLGLTLTQVRMAEQQEGAGNPTGVHHYGKAVKKTGDEAISLFQAAGDPAGVLLTCMALLDADLTLSRKDTDSLERALRTPSRGHFLTAFGNEGRIVSTALVYNRKVIASHLALCRRIAHYAATQPHPGWAAAADLNLATGLTTTKSPREALMWARMARVIAKRIGSREIQWRSDVATSKVYHALGDSTAAIISLKQAVHGIEMQRTRVAGTEQDQQSYLHDKTVLYQDLVHLYALRYEHSKMQDDAAQAFAYSEGTKGRILVDTVAHGRHTLPELLTDEEKDQYRRLSFNGQVPYTHAAALAAEADQRLAWYRLREELALYHDPMAHPGSIQELITPRQALGLMPDKDTAVLEFCVDENWTTVFVLTRPTSPSAQQANISVQTVRRGRRSVGKMVNDLRQNLLDEDHREFVTSARSAYFGLLSADIRTLLSGKKAIVIVPDGTLWLMPFQALVTSKEGEPVRYWLEDNPQRAFSMAYSLTWLQQERQRHKTQPHLPLDLLVVGNSNPAPRYANTTSNDGRVVFAAATLKSQGTRHPPRLANFLRSYYRPGKIDVQEVSHATRSTFLKRAADARILYLPAEGRLNDREPMNSYVELRPLASPRGNLTAWDIADLNLNAELGILAACDTGNGQVQSGEGLIGLSWAFALAGCPSTVSTQWKVDIASMDALMDCLHRHLADQCRGSGPPMGRAEMLSKAIREIKLRTDRGWDNPLFWAGFVIIGDGGPLRPIAGHATRRPIAPRPPVDTNVPFCNIEVERSDTRDPFGVESEAKAGDFVNYQVLLDNDGLTIGRKPRISIELPEGLTYCPGSSLVLTKHDNQNKLAFKPDPKRLGSHTLLWTFNDMTPSPDAGVYLFFKARLACENALFPMSFRAKARYHGARVPLSPDRSRALILRATCAFGSRYATTNRAVVKILQSAKPLPAISLREQVTNVSLRVAGQEWKWYREQPATATVGDKLAYALTILNTGNILIKNARVRFHLPYWLHFSGNVLTDGKASIDASIPRDSLVHDGQILKNLKWGAGDTRTISFEATITALPPANTYIGVATADVSDVVYDSPVGNQTNGQVTRRVPVQDHSVYATDSASVVIDCKPDVRLVKEIRKDVAEPYSLRYPGFFQLGEIVSYRILVQNATKRLVEKPVVKLWIPTNAQFIVGSLKVDDAKMPLSTEAASYSSGMIMTDMAPGFCQAITFQVKIVDIPDGGTMSVPCAFTLRGKPKMPVMLYGQDAQLASP